MMKRLLLLAALAGLLAIGCGPENPIEPDINDDDIENPIPDPDPEPNPNPDPEPEPEPEPECKILPTKPREFRKKISSSNSVIPTFHLHQVREEATDSLL